MAGNDLGSVGQGTVSIVADTSSFDAAMAALPARGASNAKSAMDAIKREMQANSASIARAMLSQKSAGAGDEGRNQYNRAAVTITKFREENQRLQVQMDGLAATVQRKAATVAAMAQKEAAAVVAAEKQKQNAMLATQQAMAVQGGRGAMVGGQFVSFGTRATTSGGAGGTLGKIGDEAGKSAYKMQLLAQGLDDLQYVGTMGLRPILNNLIQFSPVLGIAALAANTLYTNWDEIAQLWRSDETTKEIARQKDLATATEEAATAYEHEAKAIKGVKGETTDTRQNTAKSASDAVGGDYAVAEIARMMKENKTFTPGVPINDQARQLLTNARTGDVGANSRLEALVNGDSTSDGRFANAYRLSQLQNPTGTDKLDQDANKRAAATAAFMADEAKNRAEDARQERERRVNSMADNAGPGLRKQVLEAVAGGGSVDQNKLAESIAEHLVKAGSDAGESGKLAVEVAKKLTEEMDKKLQDEALKSGTTKATAARGGLIDLQVEGAKRVQDSIAAALADSRKDIKETKVVSAAEFDSQRLAIRPKSSDDILKQQLTEAQKVVSNLVEIKANLQNGVPATLGPRR